MKAVLKPPRKLKEYASVAGVSQQQNVADKRYGIGRIKVKEIATIGGKMKLNGIEIGKIIFQKNGKKLFTYLKLEDHLFKDGLSK